MLGAASGMRPTAAIAVVIVRAGEGGPLLPAIAVAAVVAAATAKVAHDLRALAARAVPDRVVAVVKDATAVAVAELAIRR